MVRRIMILASNLKNIMIRILIGCAVISCFGINKLTTIDECHLLCWSANRKLEWNDFTGIPDTIVYTYYGGEADVISALSILVEMDSLNNYIVFTAFNRNSSWYLDGKNKPLALEHEQGHFDLTEIFSRILRKRIENEEYYNEEFDINQLYEEIMESLDSAQHEYEVATVHGSVDNTQEKWSKLIKEELESLDDYRDDRKDCPCNWKW